MSGQFNNDWLEKSKERIKQSRRSFYFYFILFTLIIILVAVALATFLTDLTSSVTAENLLLRIVIISGYALAIGIILSLFIGYFLLAPIKKLKNAMNKVAKGDFNVSVMGESLFDEIDDLNHDFNVMTSQLRSTEIIQSDFIANVSHEFKTPLNAIEGYATLLQDENLTAEERQEYLDKILFASKKVNSLTANVLLISKIDNQSIGHNKAPFSLDEQIRQVVLLAEPLWTEKQINVEIELDEITFNANESLLFHVWHNLFSNAVKFTPNGGDIIITLEKIDEKAVFKIQDSGSGLKEEEKDFIFNQFYQGDSSHKSEGNGLGLSLVKKITKLYHGEVFCENALGGGALFTVVLPLK